MNQSFVDPVQDRTIVQAQQQYLSKVYGWMVGGLLLTGGTAWWVAITPAVLQTIMGMMLFLILAEFGLVIYLSARIGKMSKNAAILSFLTFSFINGLTLSVILLIYTEESIYTTFIITAVMFGAISLYGFTTKKSLSAMGSFMFMGLIGIIIASVVNMFIESSALNFAISIIGVIVFAGLTAWDTQKLKEMYMIQYQGNDMETKGAIIGALTLYLDFINLFLFLLRLFGNRR
jgi:FtsH-binding integral membrane protein